MTTLSIIDLHRRSEAALCTDCVAEIGIVEWAMDGASLTLFAPRLKGTMRSGRYYRQKVGAKGPPFGTAALTLCRSASASCTSFPNAQLTSRAISSSTARPLADAKAAPTFRRLDPNPPRNLTQDFMSVCAVVAGRTTKGIVVVADEEAWELTTDGGSKNLTEAITAPVLVRFYGVDATLTREQLADRLVTLQAAEAAPSIVVLDLSAAENPRFDARCGVVGLRSNHLRDLLG